MSERLIAGNRNDLSRTGEAVDAREQAECSAMPAVSVIVPARDAADTIAKTLTALANQRVDAAYEVIVVDDGSTDETASIAAGADGVQLVAGDGEGPGPARNAGAAAASADLLAFTDADCVPRTGWLEAGLAAL